MPAGVTEFIALDVGLHWLGDPWGLLRLPTEDQVDLLAYREVLLSNEVASRAVRAAARTRKISPQDLRLLSLAPMTEGAYLHARTLMLPRGKAGRDEPRQASGAHQFAQALSKRGAAPWLQRVLYEQEG